MKATAPSCLCSTHRRPWRIEIAALFIPLFHFSRPLLVLFDGERLAFVVLSTPPETAEGGLSKKSTGFATNSTAFTQKSTVFFCFFWLMGAQRPTIGEKFTARERMRHKQGGAFHGFSDRGGCFSAHRPSFRCERGAMFLPFACSRRKRPVGAKERARAGESVDEAVRKHGRKGMGTRAQKSAGRRELNVCRREEEVL